MNNGQVKKKRIKSKNKLHTFLGIPYYVIMIILVVIPFAIMILYAFNDAEGVFRISFTLNNFTNFLSNKSFVKIMMESLYLAVITTIVTLLIAYPLAYIIARSNAKMQILLLLLVTSPMWINMLIRVNAIKQVVNLINPSLLGTDVVIIFGMVYMYLPFMVLPIYTILSKIDDSLYESSADLGANKFQTIVKVIIPLSLSGILTGAMMVFLPAATTIIVPQYLGDGKRYMIGNLIDEVILSHGQYGYGAAIALVVVVIMMVLVFFVKKGDKYEEVLANEN